MARISSQISDTAPSTEDFLSGVEVSSGNNRRYALSILSDFFDREISSKKFNGSLLLSSDLGLFESGISRTVSITSIQDPGTPETIEQSITATTTSTITLGTAHRSESTTALLQAANFVKIISQDGETIFFSDIDSYNSLTGVLSLNSAMSTSVFDVFRNRGNTLQIATLGRVVLDGDLTVTGSTDIQGNVTESVVRFEQTEDATLKTLETVTFDTTGTTATLTAADGTTRDFTGGAINTRDGSIMIFWCGTEQQFQEVVTAGNIDPDILYWRT